ncbi:STAS/SEC14 domain-containing protein [Hyphococcus sp.]|uniref:STAS/SEC14 domain-containing protein n=1 Tax=Hyphococcus sp. TaxID=2038636 RepID=UPI00208B8804|nr:MAG: hypothetical protein DHS20C04_14910 [Marinicaulis sp.]
MMNIRIDDRYAYVEVEVFGRYQLERMTEVLNAMRDLVVRHGHFSQFEIHHGKPDNFWSMMSSLSKLSQNASDYDFLRKMHRYALVSDNPPIVMRVITAFARSGSIEMRIFPMHERDLARQWIEEQTMDYEAVASPR